MECDDLIRKFNLSQTLFTKFESLWEKLSINDRYKSFISIPYVGI